ncbi:MAG: NAD(+) diphosphatase [Proteobacteria bacterium]|nr:NAD(+) diphosphatase [Pseudomonadota bacterium]MBS0572828.1 NAD(+) diphosphatase [Pseudomonadota bacterium]
MHGDPAVTFAASGLDRAGGMRNDPAALAALWGGEGAMCLPLWRGRPLFRGDRAGLLPAAHPLFAGVGERLFLGLSGGAALFCATIPDWAGSEAGGEMRDRPGFADDRAWPHPLIGGDAAFVELRALLGLLDPGDAEVLATARALTGWHATHGHCACCGSPSRITAGGWQRTCPACGAHHFPRTDPVVIMLVTRGNRLLLGRSPGWPEGMFSLLAGFMEPGETIEGAVRREVAEETGVLVGRVRYLASQPWPFPASLMIGCAAEALSDEIRPDPAEIEQALWLTREELAEVFAGRHPAIRHPRRGAIAGHLMKCWLADRAA